MSRLTYLKRNDLALAKTPKKRGLMWLRKNHVGRIAHDADLLSCAAEMGTSVPTMEPASVLGAAQL